MRDWYWYESDEAKALRAQHPKVCRDFVTTLDQGVRACIGCGHSEIAHRANGSLKPGLSPRVKSDRDLAIHAFSLVKHVFPLLVAIDLGGHLTDEQYNSIILEMHSMGVDIDRGGINDIFQRAHDSLK